MVMAHTDLNDLPWKLQKHDTKPGLCSLQEILSGQVQCFVSDKSGNKKAAPKPKRYLKRYQVDVGPFFHTQGQHKQNL